MRTTIEIKPEHRALLLKIAADRGQKGFSSVVAEAIDVYLEPEARRGKQRQHALELKGALSEREVRDLRHEVAAIRDSWR